MSIILPGKFDKTRSLQSLVENRTSFTVNQAELHIFETSREVQNVNLEFSAPVIASMIKGRKIMNIRDYDQFDFLPGESVVMPAYENMNITFPDATENTPTQCTALTIDQGKFSNVLDRLNESRQSERLPLLDYNLSNLRFTNSEAFHQIINRLVFIFMENNPAKDFFVDLLLQELIVRLVQARSLRSLDNPQHKSDTDVRLANVVEFIRNNISQQFDVDTLSEKACMSSSHFFRCFKNEFGLSPLEFINQEKIEAAARLIRENPSEQLKEIYYDCGFNNYSHFSKLFKRYKKLSPAEYRDRFN
ncbi:helix-turn-helix domain-containing protein [Roseivirga sp. BDSF3-8]|uniref:helix-turn-helix domain-containing protein n=1 Tax=Roseivirga sp. BDSF3-8 TaxID=3241598 RepID=UPI00353242AF